MKTGKKTIDNRGGGKKHRENHNNPGASRSPAPEKKINGGEMNAVELAGRLAYAGKLGKARKEFIRGYIALKMKTIQAIGKTQQQYAADQGQTIKCDGGCHFCCSHYIGGSLQEAEAIVYFLYQDDRALARFLLQYPVWRGAVTKNEKLFQDTGRAFEQMMTRGFIKEVADFQYEQSRAYLSQNLSCPFLREGSCLIYPVRPKACAALFSFAGPDSCDPRNQGEIKQFAVTSEHPDPPYYYGTSSNLFLGNIPVMVFELLKGGFIYLSSLPSMQDIAQKALSDPEARQILSKFSYLMKS